ncbi:Gibberellin receptor gid1c [Thalictrum thalictroides]|uniref:Gibberellin receptor gid1c n=1 Tax=Thalictrum thalictroides TaxID=46969 RepID=A0A7J6WEC1_THATH|nr:Gibberellin receptor gid1c [Thalictrum thalictroides]
MAENNIASSQVIPWKVRVTLSKFALTDLTRRSDGTVNRRLMKLFDSCAKVPPHQSSQGLKVSDVTIDSTRNLWFRLFVPTNVPDHLRLPVLVYFHGGWFTWFSPDVKLYDVVCRQFAQRLPAIVVSVNYRLTPEFRFPAQYEDGFDTLKFLDHNSLPSNADLSRCFLAGDSAGGNIIHHVARQFAEAESDLSDIKVVGLISIQPFFGGVERTDSEIQLKGVPIISVDRADWHWKVFAPEGANRDHGAVNVIGPNSVDISHLIP